MEPLQTRTANKLQVAIDLRLLIAILITTILVMLLIWKPWNDSMSDKTQIIQVTGEAVDTAEPDEFAFTPTYQVTNTDKTAALAAITTKSEEMTTKLKALGVAEAAIKTDTSGYDDSRYGFRVAPDNVKTSTYTFEVTITVPKDLVQKVQDYLVTTEPTGSVSPRPTFSDSKRKALESEARTQASKDARAKADQSAANLGFDVKAVKSVVDGQSFGDVIPYDVEKGSTLSSDASISRLEVQAGENKLHYTVMVTYYID